MISKTELVFEDKLIIENALDLWVSCIMEKEELIGCFFKSEDPTPTDYILSGLLYCKEHKVREYFKDSLSKLAHKVAREKTEGDNKSILEFMLQLLSDKFTLISKFDSKQYFELFCDLIDYFFMNSQVSGIEKIKFNPKELLGIIIDKIIDYNKMAYQELVCPDEDERKLTEDDEQIYIGLIQLTSKIFDNFDISFCESIASEKNLIKEIFCNFLFASVFNQTETK